MTNQVIPAEAVEVAWRDDSANPKRSISRAEIWAILEAAAPHMLATAYEQGWEDGREGNRDHMPPEPNNEGEK